MANGNNETLDASFKSASDKELLRFVAKRYVEQDAMSQLTEVSLEDGVVEGMEYLLRQPLPGELPEDMSGDPILNAARDELRTRIAQRFGKATGVLNG